MDRQIVECTLCKSPAKWRVQERGKLEHYKLCSRHFLEKVGDVEFESAAPLPISPPRKAP
jgi:hypothetical protein